MSEQIILNQIVVEYINSIQNIFKMITCINKGQQIEMDNGTGNSTSHGHTL
jgi:hypothetical protein